MKDKRKRRAGAYLKRFSKKLIQEAVNADGGVIREKLKMLGDAALLSVIKGASKDRVLRSLQSITNIYVSEKLRQTKSRDRKTLSTNDACVDKLFASEID
jgi:hypothetical protein